MAYARGGCWLFEHKQSWHSVEAPEKERKWSTYNLSRVWSQGKGRNGLGAAGEVGKERADLFCLFFLYHERTNSMCAG